MVFIKWRRDLFYEKVKNKVGTWKKRNKKDCSVIFSHKVDISNRYLINNFND